MLVTTTRPFALRTRTPPDEVVVAVRFRPRTRAVPCVDPVTVVAEVVDAAVAVGTAPDAAVVVVAVSAPAMLPAFVEAAFTPPLAAPMVVAVPALVTLPGPDANMPGVTARPATVGVSAVALDPKTGAAAVAPNVPPSVPEFAALEVIAVPLAVVFTAVLAVLPAATPPMNAAPASATSPPAPLVTTGTGGELVDELTVICGLT